MSHKLRDLCNLNGISCRGPDNKYLTVSQLRKLLAGKNDKQGLLQMGGGKIMMKTFKTQEQAIAFLNNPVNEVESTVSMITNHKNTYDVVYTVSDAKYAAYLKEVKDKETVAKQRQWVLDEPRREKERVRREKQRAADKKAQEVKDDKQRHKKLYEYLRTRPPETSPTYGRSMAQWILRGVENGHLTCNSGYKSCTYMFQGPPPINLTGARTLDITKLRNVSSAIIDLLKQKEREKRVKTAAEEAEKFAKPYRLRHRESITKIRSALTGKVDYSYIYAGRKNLPAGDPPERSPGMNKSTHKVTQGSIRQVDHIYEVLFNKIISWFILNRPELRPIISKLTGSISNVYFDTRLSKLIDTNRDIYILLSDAIYYVIDGLDESIFQNIYDRNITGIKQAMKTLSPYERKRYKGKLSIWKETGNFLTESENLTIDTILEGKFN